MSSSFNGKTIIVTGGGAGIGRSACLMLAKAGANVVVVDRNAKVAEETCALIAAEDGTAISVATDISKESEVARMVDNAVESFGRLDGAFNNAGVGHAGKVLHEIDTAEWQTVLSVNLTGLFYCMKYEIIAMLKSGGGSIVNTSSGLGVVGFPTGSEYSASKHGVVGLTRSAALEYATLGIRINSVLPGATLTPLTNDYFTANSDLILGRHPIGRFAGPDEIAAGAKWLLSDEASYVTGTTLAVDGGYTAI